jgi:hypothetical protein
VLVLFHVACRYDAHDPSMRSPIAMSRVAQCVALLLVATAARGDDLATFPPPPATPASRARRPRAAGELLTVSPEATARQQIVTCSG